MKDRAPMFHTTDKSAHIEKITDYVDPKGEKAIGLQIEFSMTMSPEALDMFEPGLCAALYRDPDMISAQTKTGKVRRFDSFEKLAAKQKIVGAKIELASPSDLVSAAQSTRLPDSTVDRIKINTMKLAIEIRGRMLVWPDAAGISSIYAMRKQAILASITPPEAAGYEPDDENDADDDAQGELPDGDTDADDGDDHDGPTTSDDAPLSPTAVVAAPPEPAPRGGRKAKAEPKVTKKKRPGGNRRARVFPAALDGTGDSNPFDVAAQAAGVAPAASEEGWPFPGQVPNGTTPPAITGA